MKRSKVVLLVAAVVLVIGGLALAALGLRMGAGRYTDQWSIHLPGDLEFSGETIVYEDEIEWLDCRGIVVEAGAAEVHMEYGAGFEVSGSRETVIDEEDGKLVIQVGNPSAVGTAVNDAVHICIPDGVVIEDLEVDLGAGAMAVNGITVGQLEVDLGAGSFVMDGLVLGDIELDCAMGMIQLNHDGLAKDYHQTIDCAGGTVRIDDENYVGVSEAEVNRGAPKKLEIDVAMGSVIVQFQERIEETIAAEEAVTDPAGVLSETETAR